MNENQKFHTVRGYELLEQNKKPLTSSMEDYLEMIYRHSLEQDYLRTNTLAELLNVKASSATKMVQKLARLGLLKYEKYGVVNLTESGKEIGDFLLKRHNIVEEFLKFLGVEENVLRETELIEHNISAKTLEQLDRFNKFIEQNPSFLEDFKSFKKTFPEQ